MKYEKILTVGGEIIPVVSDSWVLENNYPGRAIIAVSSETLLSGIVRLYLGINAAKLWFTGYVENCSKIDKKQVRLTVRELPGVLAARHPLALRNVNAADVTRALSGISGLKYNLAAGADWAGRSMPHFINIGSGFEALKLLGKQLNIPDYRWQPQPDGSVRLGSSPNIKTVELPECLFFETSAAGAACALLPELRPGIKIKIADESERTIKTVVMNAEKMRLGWI